MGWKVKLIDEWRSAWKYASVQLQAAGVILMAVSQCLGDTWNQMPSNLQSKLPHASTIAMILFGLGIVGRVTQIHKPEPDASSSK